MNKNKVINPKLSLINNIGTPTNSSSKHTLAISDSGMNIYLSKQDTPTMEQVIMSNGMR